MKRKLALFLALVMILSLVPANVFASSSNSVDKVPKVADDYDGWINSPANAPKLRIEESNNGEFGSSTVTFKLELTNAEWDSTSAASMAANTTAFDEDGVATTGYRYTKRSASVMEVEFNSKGASVDSDAYIKIPMVVEVTDSGDITVEIDAVDSALSSGTYTFATAAGGDTATTIEDTDTFGDSDVLDTIEIEELKIGTLDNAGTEQEGFVLQLPKNFKWHADSTSANNGTVEYSGSFDGAAAATIVIDGTNSRRLQVTLGDLANSRTTRGSLYISGLKIVAESDASFGDVEVKIYGDDLGASRADNVTTETFVVGTYANYTVTIEANDDAEDIPAIYAGDFEGNTADEQEISQLIIKEEIASSWLTERRTRIEFPSWVKILDVEVDTDDLDNITVADADFDDYTGATSNADNVLEISGETKAVLTDTTRLDLDIWVSIEADATGDIVAEVSGSSLEEDVEVVLATAVAPITVTTTVEDVRVGIQDQPIGNITIVEATEEILTEGENLVIALDEDWFEFGTVPTVTVTKGDLEIDEDGVDVDNNILIIPIKSESSSASTIEITGITADLDRSVPEGDFSIEVGGKAIVKNSKDMYTGDSAANFANLPLDDGGFNRMYVTSEVICRVITPADDDVQAAQAVMFTIDAMEYKVGDDVMTSDVAPFIDANNRTMLPVRTFANALGVADTDILWNGVERSVTIFKGDSVVKVIIGEMAFMKNGVNVPMDTMAVIKESRTFLPVRALGQALGADIGWDAATRTVTIK